MDTVYAVAADLAALPEGTGIEDVTLKHGQLGAALLFGYLRRAGGPDLSEHGVRFVEGALGVLAERPMSASLYWGFTGIAWVTQHIFASEEMAEDLDVLDEAVAALVEGDADDVGFDMMDGLAGLGLYALERLPRPLARRTVERVVGLLEARAQRDAHGVYWRCAVHQLQPSTRRSYPQGFVMPGVAHGVAGAIGFLAAACEAGVVAPARLRPLVTAAVAWLRAQQADEGRFSFELVPGKPVLPARDAWCHGAPGIPAMLWRAGRAFAEPGWSAQALTTARATAAHAPEDTGAGDAGLCHGAAGLAHMFNRLYQASGDELLGASARAWCERTLAMRTPGQGHGGFLAFEPGRDAAHPWQVDPGLLLGSAGVALALLAACSDVEPRWDRLLLLDLA